MVSLGSATAASTTGVPQREVTVYSPVFGFSLGMVTVPEDSGGTPVDPKRFLNVGGTAVPIQ